MTCVDYSEAGLEKTRTLAKQNGVEVTCVCADLGQMNLQAASWDLIIGIFAHFPKSVKEHIWPQVYDALKPGGQLIAEVYDEEQLRFGTGGPQQLDFLYTVDELETLLSTNFQHRLIEKVYREVHEGTYHNGASATIQVLAHK